MAPELRHRILMMSDSKIVDVAEQLHVHPKTVSKIREQAEKQNLVGAPDRIPRGVPLPGQQGGARRSTLDNEQIRRLVGLAASNPRWTIEALRDELFKTFPQEWQDERIASLRAKMQEVEERLATGTLAPEQKHKDDAKLKKLEAQLTKVGIDETSLLHPSIVWRHLDRAGIEHMRATLSDPKALDGPHAAEEFERFVAAQMARPTYTTFKEAEEILEDHTCIQDPSRITETLADELNSGTREKFSVKFERELRRRWVDDASKSFILSDDELGDMLEATAQEVQVAESLNAALTPDPNSNSTLKETSTLKEKLLIHYLKSKELATMKAAVTTALASKPADTEESKEERSALWSRYLEEEGDAKEQAARRQI